MSSALWCVMNGRALAPPGITCIIGVSTSMNCFEIMKLRMADITLERTMKALREFSLTIRST
ncbi:Uncharacterised protein [Vibrio cholerae]|nr:Uncharacterised protein [Vibrio cholerae]CSB47827.1 Uncharacterised protein [Vibrio cholerae]CSC59273.1 Uncharacterised protein [Vibrio cholerae]